MASKAIEQNQKLRMNSMQCFSRDEKNLVPVSLCPGTRAGANVPGRPGTKLIKKFQRKNTRFPVLEHHFPVLEHHIPVLEHPFLF